MKTELYRAEVEVFVGGKVVDQPRPLSASARSNSPCEQGFTLNGETVKLHGGCVHHDNGLLGAAAFPAPRSAGSRSMKASGFNAIRSSHNPPSPAFLDACDRLGMLVIDEAFDCWEERQESR